MMTNNETHNLKLIRIGGNIYILENEDDLYYYCNQNNKIYQFAKEINNPISCGAWCGKCEGISDNICDLIDEFILVIKHSEKRISRKHYKNFNKVVKEFERWKNDETVKIKLYGGIWCNNGLVFVCNYTNNNTFVLLRNYY